MFRYAACLLIIGFAGCSATPKVNLADEAAHLTGIDNAIVFRADAAQDLRSEPLPATLALSDAVVLALRHDPRIQSSIAQVRAAQADAQQTRLLPNPIFNIDVRFPESGGSRIVEATLTDDLLSLLTIHGRIKAADSRLREATADALVIVLDVIAEAKDAFSAVQVAGAELDTLERRREILMQMRSVANSRLTAGEGTRLDVLTMDAQLAQVDLDISDKSLERNESSIVLARLTGNPAGVADWRLPAWVSPPALQGDETAWIKAAMAHRPEIQSHTWELAALGEEVKLASLSPFQGAEAGVHGERDQSWVVGPTVTTPLPIFDLGGTARAKATAQRIAAHHQLEQKRWEVIEEVRRAYAAYTAAAESLRLAQERLLPLQESQKSQAEIAYRNGEIDLTTLLLANADLQDTQSKVIQIQQKLTQASIRLERAAGGAAIAERLAGNASSHPPADSQPTSQPGATR